MASQRKLVKSRKHTLRNKIGGMFSQNQRQYANLQNRILHLEENYKQVGLKI